MDTAHPAIWFIEVGRGYGKTAVPVVTLGGIGSSKTYHVVDPEAKTAICGTKGRFVNLVAGCDPKTIIFNSRPVCARCQVALGHVPMPELLKEQEAE